MKVRDTSIRNSLLEYVENKALPVSAKEIHSSGGMEIFQQFTEGSIILKRKAVYLL